MAIAEEEVAHLHVEVAVGRTTRALRRKLNRGPSARREADGHQGGKEEVAMLGYRDANEQES
uniref:Uncharacterized protein n=1 Tax=Oryza meridionalis TaxID=40149 RepID=A0A0E0EXF3_9ORYZ